MKKIHLILSILALLVVACSTTSLLPAAAPTLEAFFTQRLITQKQASRHTIAAYRNAFGPGHTAYGNASFHIHPDNLDYADSIYADFDKLSSFYFHGFHS